MLRCSLNLLRTISKNLYVVLSFNNLRIKNAATNFKVYHINVQLCKLLYLNLDFEFLVSIFCFTQHLASSEDLKPKI